MDEKKVKSGITGKAQVVFGGGVCVELGRSDNELFAVGLSEFKHPAEKAGMEPKTREKYPIQVVLVFPDLDTLNNFRSILDDVESRIKGNNNGKWIVKETTE